MEKEALQELLESEGWNILSRQLAYEYQKAVKNLLNVPPQDMGKVCEWQQNALMCERLMELPKRMLKNIKMKEEVQNGNER